MPKNKSLLETVNLLSELVVFETYNFEEFLKKLIKLILKLIPADSCLIYFYDTSHQEIILAASKKPHEKLIGKIKMKPGEGITGWVAENKEIVALEKEAYKDIRFKQFKELPEDDYEAFLSIPIIDKSGVIGIINIQNTTPCVFEKSQIETLEAMVKIIASAFQKVVLDRQVNTLQIKLEDRKAIDKAKGILMHKDKLTEKEAYAIIRNEAMKKRKTMREIAEAVLLVWG